MSAERVRILIRGWPGFHVNVGKVEEAANGIKLCMIDQSSFELRSLCGDTAVYGHDGIHNALLNCCVCRVPGTDSATAGSLTAAPGRGPASDG
ncbi:hypothetical protein [Amycolatopsis sp. CB00013]|uniref:hypothetical protein n=1 Tax=Amycolatopsis sp. CB00013 TaxID=1703945 RepID=UPI00093F9465|nr:hypothetical protein [Amycolatopsis sp. CB00013]OKJ98796.1 hypothetical protein AMK34_18410 [Amycolatopsis sp. CB00013]